MTDFIGWLENELDKRRWKAADLSREAGISEPTVTNLRQGKRNPGAGVCVAIAKAFEMPPETVFRRAGLLPDLPGPEEDKLIEEVLTLVRNLNLEERREVLDYAFHRYRKQSQRRIDEQEYQQRPGSQNLSDDEE